MISALRLKQNKNHYCSSKCQYAHRRIDKSVTPRYNKKIQIERVCAFCKKHFFTYPRYGHKYCSRQCWRVDTVRKNSVGSNEEIILDSVETKLGKKIERQYPLDKYVVDGYCKEINTVFEVDERSHFHKPKMIKDKRREDRLKQLYKCIIIRFIDMGDGQYVLRQSIPEVC